jgi:hypothetical protein
MKKPYKQAYQALKVMGVPVFTNEDHDRLGNFSINAETSEGHRWADYYVSPQSWVFGVSPELETVLNQFGLFAEWQNPGCLGVYEA